MKTKEILKSLKTNEFLTHSTISLGYTPGLPMAASLNGIPCLIVPFLKYQMTGKVDATQVYAPRYVAVVEVKHGTVVGFNDLSFDKRFGQVDFNKPIGLFRHAAIHHLNKMEFDELRNKLYGMIDTLCESMEKKEEFDEMDTQRIAKLFSMLIEPSVKPFYHAIDKSFFEAYIGHDQ